MLEGKGFVSERMWWGRHFIAAIAMGPVYACWGPFSPLTPTRSSSFSLWLSNEHCPLAGADLLYAHPSAHLHLRGPCQYTGRGPPLAVDGSLSASSCCLCPFCFLQLGLHCETPPLSQISIF